MSGLKHEITTVSPGSIAHELELAPGDVLISVNGKSIVDVLDYRFHILSEELLLEIEKPDGEIWELEIEKDEAEDLGLEFESPLMSATRKCRNKCIFCFVDQQPQGLRPSLYIKDDDPRLSFLHGNYVTLTNLSDAEIKRLAGYHLSPLRISVHAADMDLRKKMTGNNTADKLFHALDIFAEAGIRMHFQAVLCKGVNDGTALDYTIEALAARQGAESLAIVPAGLTRHRDGLHKLEQFTKPEASAVLAQILAWQEKCKKNLGTAFVFPADEWYIMAGQKMPEFACYENFPQLDNGVGMARLFECEFKGAAGATPKSEVRGQRSEKTENLVSRHIGIVTGLAAADFMRGMAVEFETRHSGKKITVYAIRNDFYGENITVSGLLTGADVIAQLRSVFTQGGANAPSIIFLPENAFRVDSDEMLDGTNISQIRDALGVSVEKGSADGGEFFKQLLKS